jgi:photosystem II stability/assembly factor-like uncharacterized protein
MAAMPFRRSAAGTWSGVLVFFACGIISAQSALQEPVRITYECTDGDADAFGFNCTTDDPCPVFLELASVEATAGRLIAAGNLHTKNVTLYGLVLASDDDGTTWTEPQARIRSAALEQVQFLNAQNGWITGVSVDPLARNPFLLVTGDAGRTWQQKPILEDTKYATITQLRFDTATHGELVLDVAQPKAVRQELYETMTGGDTWELKQVNNKPIPLKDSRAPSTLRVRADAATGTFLIERGSGRTWKSVASFAVHVTDCQ